MHIDDILRRNRKARLGRAVTSFALALVLFHVTVVIVLMFIFVAVPVLGHRVFDAMWKYVLISYGAAAFVFLIAEVRLWRRSGWPPVFGNATTRAAPIVGDLQRIRASAFAFSELVTGGAGQFAEAIDELRRAIRLDPTERSAAEAFLDALRAQGTNPRYHPLDAFDVAPDLLAKLIRAEVVHIRAENNVMLVGLNRDYD